VNTTTDTQEQQVPEGPLSEEDAVALLMQPDAEETEDETDEANPEEAEAEEVAEDDAAPDEAEGDEDDEAEADELDDDEDDSDDEDEGEDEEETEEKLHTVKVNGETREVTYDELVRGYSGQAFIQEGMERNKQMEKELRQQEAQYQQLASTVAQERQALLQAYEQATQTGFMPEPVEPDPSLLESDPVAYFEQDAQYRQQSKAYAAQRQQLEYHQQQQLAYQQQQREAVKQQAFSALREEVPELRDAKTAPKFAKQMQKTAQEVYQLSAQDLESIIDPKFYKILADVTKYHEAQGAKNESRKPRSKQRSATRPSGKPRKAPDNSRKALERAKRTQSDDDFVAALLTSKS